MPRGSGGGRPLGSQNQPLQQGALVDGYPLIVEDLGTNTNPRRYEKDNGFYSAPTVRVGAAATPLYTVATTPARTAGESTTIYTLLIENETGSTVTAWLEIGGVVVTLEFHVNNAEAVVIPFIAGLTLGDNDINCNASVDDVVFQIIGTEA